MIKGVLFDFDGTLTRPGSLDFQEIKGALGCPLDKPILEYLETLSWGRRAELMRILEEKENAAAEASHPNEGAERCLSLLKKNGLLLGILTRNSLSSVRKSLLKFEGITVKEFSALITREVVSLPKPRPEGVLEGARQMGLLPSEILVVGDFRYDVMAGKAAGAYTAFLTNGGRSAMASGDPEPDYIIAELQGIFEIVELPKE